ncbi:MAG TPA: site-specific integrase [Ohtaekwangia sp.]|nr:site-specific integrase [Ohtaekwangia sp.]
MKVTLRQKTITKGKITLFLDYYPPVPHPETGKATRREFLRLYLFTKPKDFLEREHNKETKMLAETIKAKRQLAIQNKHYDFLSKEKQDLDFIQYFETLMERRKESKNNYGNWKSALNYLKKFANSKPMLISNMTIELCEQFKAYINNTKSYHSEKKKLSQNSRHSYFMKFMAALKTAYREGMLKTDLAGRLKPIKAAEVRREYLTLEELNALAKTECDDELLKRASLFSALSGLRWSDIYNLKWINIQYSEDMGGYYIAFTQQKTRSVEWHPISDQARDYLGIKGRPDEKVFRGLEYSAYFAILLSRWAMKAGITKKVTFHNFRHTYATLQFTNGSDILTVSKLLGHKNIKTTLIYTKVIDSVRREAANRIKLID